VNAPAVRGIDAFAPIAGEIANRRSKDAGVAGARDGTQPEMQIVHQIAAARFQYVSRMQRGKEVPRSALAARICRGLCSSR